MDQLPRLGKRELICLLLFTCNYVVSVWRGFLFLWVLGMGYVILLWHSLSLQYNYLIKFYLNRYWGRVNAAVRFQVKNGSHCLIIRTMFLATLALLSRCELSSLFQASGDSIILSILSRGYRQILKFNIMRQFKLNHLVTVKLCS